MSVSKITLPKEDLTKVAAELATGMGLQSKASFKRC